MRLKRLFWLDLRCQARYGFYFLYAVLTVLYAAVLLALPKSVRQTAAAILIFSDPAAMGLFFMGAIVLLEKSQRTPCALAVSPVGAAEYILAKTGSLAAVSLAVAAVLACVAGVRPLLPALFGTFLGSVVFTLFGMLVAANVESLNAFLLWVAPAEAVCFVPAVLYALGIAPAWIGDTPVGACMDMIGGRLPSAAGLWGTIAAAGGLFVLSRLCVLRMWDRMEGGKL